jgi:hypothetical protein
MDLLPLDTPSHEDIYIFNPTKEPFSITYAYDFESPRVYTLESYEGKKFPRVIADHIAKHLKNKIISDKPGVITEAIIEKVLKTIYLS